MVVFYWDQRFLVGWFDCFFVCSIGEKTFLVGLVDQLFQPASNRVEMVDKEFARLCCVIVAHVTTIPRSYRASTKNGWKSVLLRRVKRINPNRLRLERLIPIDHDLYVHYIDILFQRLLNTFRRFLKILKKLSEFRTFSQNFIRLTKTTDDFRG